MVVLCQLQCLPKDNPLKAILPHYPETPQSQFLKVCTTWGWGCLPWQRNIRRLLIHTFHSYRAKLAEYNTGGCNAKYYYVFKALVLPFITGIKTRDLTHLENIKTDNECSLLQESYKMKHCKVATHKSLYCDFCEKFPFLPQPHNGLF